jgi:hypothetical protein
LIWPLGKIHLASLEPVLSPVSQEALSIREKAKGIHMNIPPPGSIKIPNIEAICSTANPLPEDQHLQLIDLTGYFWKHPNNAVTLALQSTPWGRWALSIDELFGVTLLAVPGTVVVSYEPLTNTVRLGGDLPFSHMQERYICEMTHVFQYHVGRWGADLERMLEWEADAEVNAIRHILRLYPHRPLGLLERAYSDAYGRGYQCLPLGASDQERDLVGQASGRKAVLTAFKRGSVRTSTTGETYGKYYRKLSL